MESVASGKSLYGIAGTMVMSEGVLVNSTKKKKKKTLVHQAVTLANAIDYLWSNV